MEAAMLLSRRRFMHLAAVATVPASPRMTHAQSSQPARIIVGFTPGSTTDVLARLIAQWLTERLGRPFLVENRPGAGSKLATETVVQARPDGDTLLLVVPANVINASLAEKA